MPSAYSAPDPADGWWGNPDTGEVWLPNAYRYRGLVLGWYLPGGREGVLNLRTGRVRYCGHINTGKLGYGGKFSQIRQQDCLSHHCEICGWAVRIEPVLEVLDLYLPPHSPLLFIQFEPEDWEAVSRMLSRKKGSSYRTIHYDDGSKAVLTDLPALAPRAADNYRFQFKGQKVDALACFALGCFLPDLRSGKGPKITGRGWGWGEEQAIRLARGGFRGPRTVPTGEAGDKAAIHFYGGFLKDLKRKMLIEYNVVVTGNVADGLGSLRPSVVPKGLTGPEQSEFHNAFYARLWQTAQDLADRPQQDDVPAVRRSVALTHSGDILGIPSVPSPGDSRPDPAAVALPVAESQVTSPECETLDSEQEATG